MNSVNYFRDEIIGFWVFIGAGAVPDSVLVGLVVFGSVGKWSLPLVVG